MRDLTKHIPKLVTREDNFNLVRTVTEEEVSDFIKEIQNGKATGLDVFNVNFFKACWHIVKKSILIVMEDSKMNKTILKALNTSFISLIHKQDIVLTPDRFRPIALCNVVYKIYPKLLPTNSTPFFLL